MAAGNRKWGFLALCCGTYLCAYLCRVNLSSALGKMESALGVTAAALGLLGTAYFFFYACSQLICGFFGDRVRPERLVILGLLGVTLTNVGISFCRGYAAILALWCLNGVFQSMFWGPMSRLLAGRFAPAERVTVSTFYSLSMPCGYILSWSVLAPALESSPWPLNFRVPGLIILLPLALWLGVVCTGKKQQPLAIASTEKPSFRLIFSTVREERLWLAALCCLCNGMLKESFTIWAPMILGRLLGVDGRQSALYLVLFPLCNALFIAGNGRIIHQTRTPLKRVLMTLFTLMALCAGVLMLGVESTGLTVVLMAMISGFGYACNHVFLGMLPMSYAEKNITSSLVGIFDFSAYIGAGIAAYGLGLLMTGSDLRPIAAVWLAAAAVAAVAMVFARGGLGARRETKKA